MEDKEDGFVMWHPTIGLKPSIVCDTPQQAIACQQTAFVCHTTPEDLLANGWRIRPVKLTFLDEDKK